jgi:hypothetical protein
LHCRKHANRFANEFAFHIKVMRALCVDRDEDMLRNAQVAVEIAAAHCAHCDTAQLAHIFRDGVFPMPHAAAVTPST